MKKITALIILSVLINLTWSSALVHAKINMSKPDMEDAIPVAAMADPKLELASQAAVLMEGSTGKVLYEKNKDERLKPASITKIMTLLLIFEALESGQIKLTDDVSVSEHAASMGGSQVFLEPYEVQKVDTMIKCISIASANDASVAMAEHIAGSEEEFVARMNAKAKELGMNNTNFVNCTGLDTDNHYTTAYDVALMSRELITKYPQISNYATIWMDTFVHETKKGRTEFGLTNTNKLIKSYKGITGLKTGSTSVAKYCLSATARRNNMDLIAVIMAAPDTKTRFMEAAKLLNYGFANYSIYVDDNKDLVIDPVKVTKGVSDFVEGEVKKEFSYLCDKGKKAENIRKEVVLYDKIKAPVKAGDKIGEVVYYYENAQIGSVDILAKSNVEKAGFLDCLAKALKRFFIQK
ncbi:D-alanyl-D-alanine carboxypeptidase (penicillin-binding protein 5/6) [Herbinix hemicellulosilytica]|uniref:serine-type D-Ala-D-Ala carboxypeptidase n=1 Tax=Herbinix hemicellulosilytica TaxID=1564487 RepID=A0A0H5SHL5_HERHM|nr:D-alanyl-D-alanine carboxypeptidase family protein [Herbinix hemicellulosilytica]RBP60609.1 D-alanyl-D-alanine carboxypeptidase (penicillin-binding protein 5/6) [Herbinix hemicellulosilytica]CRZ34296.1 D-alanyl-D-alanine carboxypeptidase DacF [Herbinix hemicellulosilytica]